MADGRILLVDDNPMNLTILEELLADDYVTALAGSGEEAQVIAPSFSPDVILLDAMMPGVDGYEICRWIRSHSELMATRIIMVSAKATAADIEQGLAAGANDYVTKPIDMSFLTEAIREQISAKDSKIGVSTSPTSADKAFEVQTADDRPPLDPEVFARLRAMDANGTSGFLQELAALYSDRSENDFRRLASAIASGDAGCTRKAVHSLRSSSSNLGALRLASLCAELEAEACEGKLDCASKLLLEIDFERGRVGIALAGELRVVARTCPEG